MWTQQREDLEIHGPVRVEWVHCEFHLGLDGATKQSFCKPMKPSPEKLEGSITKQVARCYSAAHRRSTDDTARQVKKTYETGTMEGLAKGVVPVLFQVIQQEQEEPIFGKEGPVTNTAPQCPPDRPGCDYGMVAKHHVKNIPVGYKITTKRSASQPQLADQSALPKEHHEALKFFLAVPGRQVGTSQMIDPRFEVATEGRSVNAVADDLAKRLDGIDIATEVLLIREAYWVNRALIAAIRHDRAGLDEAYRGLNSNPSIDRSGLVRWTTSAIDTIRKEKLLFEDPCQK